VGLGYFIRGGRSDSYSAVGYFTPAASLFALSNIFFLRLSLISSSGSILY
jgi:hypothetical protein